MGLFCPRLPSVSTAACRQGGRGGYEPDADRLPILHGGIQRSRPAAGRAGTFPALFTLRGGFSAAALRRAASAADRGGSARKRTTGGTATTTTPSPGSPGTGAPGNGGTGLILGAEASLDGILGGGTGRDIGAGGVPPERHAWLAPSHQAVRCNRVGLTRTSGAGDETPDKGAAHAMMARDRTGRCGGGFSPPPAITAAGPCCLWSAAPPVRDARHPHPSGQRSGSP